MVLVVAGRDPIERSTPDSPKRWLPYLDDQDIYSISLDSFTEIETRAYLAKRGITDSDRITTIWQLSGGLPLYLGLLTSNPRGKVDPTKDVVVNFLRWIPEEEQVKRQLTLDAALLSRPFNQDDLEAFSYLPEEKRSALYHWLIELPFVQTSPVDGRHNYHDLVQALFSRHIFQRSRKEYYATRSMLANYYQVQLEKTQAEGNMTIIHASEQSRSIYRSTEWLELAMAIAYQLFLQPDDTSHHKAFEQVLNAYEYTELSQPGEIIRVLQKLIQEQPNNQLRASALHSIKLLLQYIEADPPNTHWQELVAAADVLLKIVANEPYFSPELLAHLYRKRGFAYSRFKEYGLAIEDYNTVIALDSNYARAYASRGRTYRSLGEYELAIKDYNRAIELRPNYAWAYTGRGQTYRLREEYTQAIKDLNRAIEIEPNNAWNYFVRGYIHLWLKDVVQARADFIRSRELNPKSVNAGWMVEWSGIGLEKTDAGLIERLEAIAELDPENCWAFVCRGVALWLNRGFEETLILLDQAIELNSEVSDPYFWKGMAYASLMQDEAAIAAVEQSLELGLPPIPLTPLRWFEKDRPEFYHQYVLPLEAVSHHARRSW